MTKDVRNLRIFYRKARRILKRRRRSTRKDSQWKIRSNQTCFIIQLQCEICRQIGELAVLSFTVSKCRLMSCQVQNGKPSSSAILLEQTLEGFSRFLYTQLQFTDFDFSIHKKQFCTGWIYEREKPGTSRRPNWKCHFACYPPDWSRACEEFLASKWNTSGASIRCTPDGV